MTLTTRTAPQKSFGRRAGPAPRAREPQPPAVPVEEILKDAQPASNWLSEMVGPSAPAMVGQSAPAAFVAPVAPPPLPRLGSDPSRDDTAPRLSAGHVLASTLAVLGKNPVTFLAVLAAIALPEQFIAYLPVSLGAPAGLVMPLFTTLGCMALYVAAFQAALASLKGETVNLDVCLRAMARLPGSAAGAVAMTVSFLSLMLIVPAVAFAPRWALAAPVAIVEGCNGRARSVALTAPYRAQVRLLVLLLAVLTLLRGLGAAVFSTGPVLNALAGDWLFPMLLTLFTAVAGAVLYRELVPSGAEPSHSGKAQAD
jgi:hypothetical protein